MSNTNLHDKMLAAIDALFSASDGEERDQAEEQLLDVRDELLKQLAQPTGACAMCGALQGDQIIKLAREAGMVWASGLNGAGYHINHPDDLERFAKLVAEHSASVEREACAKECEKQAEKWKQKNLMGYVAVLVDDAAAVIRSRSSEH